MVNRIIHISDDQLALLAHVLNHVDPVVVAQGFEHRPSFFAHTSCTELSLLISGIKDIVDNPSADPLMVYGLNM